MADRLFDEVSFCNVDDAAGVGGASGAEGTEGAVGGAGGAEGACGAEGAGGAGGAEGAFPIGSVIMGMAGACEFCGSRSS